MELGVARDLFVGNAGGVLVEGLDDVDDSLRDLVFAQVGGVEPLCEYGVGHDGTGQHGAGRRGSHAGRNFAD